MRKTETKTAIDSENAIALYGLIPTKRLISNCLSMKPIKEKAPWSATKFQSPQVGPSGRNLPETQDPKVEEENDP